MNKHNPEKAFTEKNGKKSKLLRYAAYALLILTVLLVEVVPARVEVKASQIYTWGSHGETVKTIQSKLKRWGYYSGAVDGIYGYKTYEAVVYFQRTNGLKQDGIVGPKTLEALGMPVVTPKPAASAIPTKTPAMEKSAAPAASPAAPSNPAYAVTTPPEKELSGSDISTKETDIWLLARLINGEGRGESYLGQVAIGAVTLNRVKSPLFPNTLAGVIYQPGAYDAVRDGQINLIPSESCVNAARDAYNGWDPVDGALFYWNPTTATSKWILTLTVTKTIGNHVFALN